MDLEEVGRGGGDWIESAQDRDRWRALVSTVKHIGVPENVGNFSTGCKDWLAAQGLCCVE
jgi:hypothetical protein